MLRTKIYLDDWICMEDFLQRLIGELGETIYDQCRPTPIERDCLTMNIPEPARIRVMDTLKSLPVQLVRPMNTERP